MQKSQRKQAQSYQDKIISFLEESPNYTKSMFTPFEDDIIRKYYPKKGSVALAKALNKTRRQITARAQHMGVKIYNGKES